MLKNDESLKNRGLVLTAQPEPEFSQTCRFWEMLDYEEIIMYMNINEILMTGCRAIDKKHQKKPPIMGVSSICAPPKAFFQKSASVTLVSLWYPNFKQKRQVYNL